MQFSMCHSVLLLLTISANRFACGKDLNTESPQDFTDGSEKVLGPPVDPPHSRPYIAQVESFSGSNRYVRGGVIYDEWTIITPCYAIKERSKTICAGKFYINQQETSQQERKECFMSEHPKHGSGGARDSFDYCVIHLSQPLKFNEFVQRAVLPKYKGEYPTTKCNVTGWGGASSGAGQSEELREVHVDIVDMSACGNRHSTSLCISRGACRMDWGSPVTCPDKSGVNTVIGYTSGSYPACQPTNIAKTVDIDTPWLEEIFANATKRCRGGDCCKNDGKLNGNPVIPHSRPYVVQIHYKGSKEVATGVLINAYTILTSAHKLDNILFITAGKHLFGKYEGTQQTRRPCSVSKHQNIDKPQNAYGFGLIHLSDRFVLNEYVNAISIAPKGKVPKDKCSIIGWQGNSSETVLREQLVEFKDPKSCKSPHETVTCVKEGACLHDWGSPVICTYDSKIYVQAIVGSAKAYCENAILASIPDLPRDWLATELKKAETTCGKSTL